MDSLNIEGLPATKDIGVILGFFHNRISQQEKDIGLLNRRVSELFQTSQFADHEKLNTFIEEGNQKFESFASSIKTLKSQVLILTNSSPLISPNFRISENLQIERKQEIRDEFNKINSEIESLKSHMIQLSQNQEQIAKESNEKSKSHKKSKINKQNNISLISIVDIKPKNYETPKINQIINEHQEFKQQLKDNQKNIEILRNEINHIKNEMKIQENNMNEQYSIEMRRIDKIQQFIMKFNSENQNKSEILILNDNQDIVNTPQNSQLPKTNFATVPILSNQIENIYPQYDNAASKRIQAENQKNGENPNGLLSNSPTKKCISPATFKNSSPRKTSTHYTIISGESLKRPGTQIGARKGLKPTIQKYPL